MRKKGYDEANNIKLVMSFCFLTNFVVPERTSIMLSLVISYKLASNLTFEALIGSFAIVWLLLAGVSKCLIWMLLATISL